MAYSKSKARKILKACKAIGEVAVAAKFGITVDSVRRACRIAENKSLLTVDEAKRSGRKAHMMEDDWEWGDFGRRLSASQQVQGLTFDEPTPVEQDNRPILVIPDLHAPYHHPEALEFLAWVQEWRGCREKVASVGDAWDFHSMSFHQSEPEAVGPEEEYQRIRDFSAELTEVFPEGDIVLGNHCDIPKRKMKELGLATSMLRNPNDLYNMPDTWAIHPLYYVLEPDTWDVLVEHGCGSGGKYGCANTSKEKRCSYVQGHTHSNAAVIYSQNYKNTTFGLNVGCLIDSSSFAFKYAKHTTRKGNVGCGVVYSGSHAEFVPMDTWKNYKTWF